MKTIEKMMLGMGMGFMLGAGIMMTSTGSMLRRDVKHKANVVKRMMKNM